MADEQNQPDYYFSKPPELQPTDTQGGYQYRPLTEDSAFKMQYTKIDFQNKGFQNLKETLEKLSIPREIITDLVDKLEILVNNAGKMNINMGEIEYLLESFNTFWDNFCIYVIENSRWINELNNVRSFAENILLQEYHKSIGGWQGNNILRTRIEQRTSYDLRQEQVASEQKRGFFRNTRSKKPISPNSAQNFGVAPKGRR